MIQLKSHLEVSRNHGITDTLDDCGIFGLSMEAVYASHLLACLLSSCPALTYVLRQASRAFRTRLEVGGCGWKLPAASICYGGQPTINSASTSTSTTPSDTSEKQMRGKTCMYLGHLKWTKVIIHFFFSSFPCRIMVLVSECTTSSSIPPHTGKNS